MSKEMIGMIAAFMKPARGWIVMAGQSVKVATYPELAKAVPYSWVANGMITLPDLAGMTLVGKGTNEGRTFDLGDMGGEHSHVLTVAETAEHHHDVLLKANGSTPDVYHPLFFPTYATGDSEIIEGILTSDNGGSEAHENMPPYLVVRWCIYGGR